MRLTFRTMALVLVLLALLVPFTSFASDGPCPDDPELSAECVDVAPPYYAVINRSVEYLYPDRPGTGCQPIILNHPECTDCLNDADAIDFETEVCATLPAPTDPTVDTIVYEMCCDCATDPAGNWWFRIHILDPAGGGTCPIDPNNPDWIEGLPPGTGIDLPMPVIVGGLALIGAGLLAAGVLVRRRSMQTA